MRKIIFGKVLIPFPLSQFIYIIAYDILFTAEIQYSVLHLLKLSCGPVFIRQVFTIKHSSVISLVFFAFDLWRIDIHIYMYVHTYIRRVFNELEYCGKLFCMLLYSRIHEQMISRCYMN